MYFCMLEATAVSVSPVGVQGCIDLKQPMQQEGCNTTGPGNGMIVSKAMILTLRCSR